jgi:transcriptional regulator with XRE-family HTH domain
MQRMTESTLKTDDPRQAIAALMRLEMLTMRKLGARAAIDPGNLSRWLNGNGVLSEESQARLSAAVGLEPAGENDADLTLNQHAAHVWFLHGSDAENRAATARTLLRDLLPHELRRGLTGICLPRDQYSQPVRHYILFGTNASETLPPLCLYWSSSDTTPIPPESLGLTADMRLAPAREWDDGLLKKMQQATLSHAERYAILCKQARTADHSLAERLLDRDGKPTHASNWLAAEMRPSQSDSAPLTQTPMQLDDMELALIKTWRSHHHWSKEQKRTALRAVANTLADLKAFQEARRNG